MRSVRDIPVTQNIPVLVRAAMNVPVEKGAVVNDYRLRRAVPTLALLAKGGARVVVISHIGEKGTETLAPVAEALGRLIPNVSFCSETIGENARAAIRALSSGHILVLENLRRHKGEVMNDPAFAKELAMLADVFVQDSFDTCHRTHASIIGVPQLLPSYAGLVVEEEVRELSQALSPKHPALAIVGGAKFSTKEDVLTRLLDLYDHLFVGGALANDFLKVSGEEVGKSLVSGGDSAPIEALLHNPKLVLPADARVIPQALLGTPGAAAKARIAARGDVHSDETILDHGPKTIERLAGLTHAAETILWNGPLGNYENGFTEDTDECARLLAASGAHTIVGGGDTIASIESLGLMDRLSFVSTGGGAMLDFLAKGTLPGIAALDAH